MVARRSVTDFCFVFFVSKFEHANCSLKIRVFITHTHTHTHTHCKRRGACGVTIIVVVNSLSEPSSNPGYESLRLISRKCSLERYKYVSSAQGYSYEQIKHRAGRVFDEEQIVVVQQCLVQRKIKVSLEKHKHLYAPGTSHYYTREDILWLVVLACVFLSIYNEHFGLVS